MCESNKSINNWIYLFIINSFDLIEIKLGRFTDVENSGRREELAIFKFYISIIQMFTIF